MTWKVSDDPVDFDEAIAWFRKRVKMTRAERDKLDAKARRQAFWVANIAQLDLVAETWAALDRAASNGTTLEDFKKEIGAKLEAAWRGSVDDPAWRLETIFRTNVQGAYGAGRYEQATHEDILEDHPIWMFDAILDGRETDICRACDGTKLPANDPWWKTHIAPLHYNCRSTFITLTEKEAGRITLVKPTATPQGGFGAAPDDGEAIDQWAAQKVANAPAPVQAVQRQKTHDPAHWAVVYSHYGDAAATVAYGRAALELGLDIPVDDVAKALDGLSAKVPLGGLRVSLDVKQAKRAGRKSLREVIDDPKSDAKTKARTQIAAMLAGHARQVTPPSKLDFSETLPSAKRKLAKENLERAKAFLGGLLDGALKHKVSISWSNARAQYDLKGNIFTDWRAETLPHEWGHALEDLNGKLLERAIAFLETRTKHEQEQSLQKLRPGAGYNANEMAKPDAFAHAYTGKTYKSSQGKRIATEVTSMGLQALFEGDPKWALVDIEHLMFTLGQLANR